MSDIQYDKLNWYKVAELDELDEGRVKSATAGTKSIAVVHFDGVLERVVRADIASTRPWTITAPTRVVLSGKARLKKVLMTNAGCAVPGTAGILIP